MKLYIYQSIVFNADMYFFVHTVVIESTYPPLCLCVQSLALLSLMCNISRLSSASIDQGTDFHLRMRFEVPETLPCNNKHPLKSLNQDVEFVLLLCLQNDRRTFHHLINSIFKDLMPFFLRWRITSSESVSKPVKQEKSGSNLNVYCVYFIYFQKKTWCPAKQHDPHTTTNWKEAQCE